MSNLTLTHQIAAPLEVLPADLGLKAQTLTTAANVLTIADAATFEAGNRILMDLHATGKAIEAQRVSLKKPITELGKAIDSVVASVAGPLDAAKRNLQTKVAGYQRELQEAAAKAMREAEEQQRKEREAAEQERIQRQLEADEKAKAEAAELEAVLGKPVEPERVIVPPIERTNVVMQPAPVPMASAVQVRKVQRVEFTDRMLVPVQLAGVILRPIDEAEVKKMLLAGVPVPGARLIEVEQFAASRI